MAAHGRLMKNFRDKVFNGAMPFSLLTVTSTGTGVAAGHKIGLCVLDSSAGDWFIATDTAGTYVKINA